MLVVGLGLLLAIPAGAQSSSSANPKPASKTSTSHKSSSTVRKTSTAKKASTSKTTHKTSSHSSTAAKSKKSKGKASTKGSWRTRGQQSVDGPRAKQIQTALIESHYLDGAPSGVWDARTKAAMEKYQADNGWQTKKIPDARALIKLGLGPDHANLINPETAAIQKPEPGKGGSPQN